MPKKQNLAIEFQFKVPIVFEKDKDLNEYVVTCPILDICSQGSTKKEAEKNIREAIGLFLLSCIERDTLNEVLKECGFKPMLKKPISALKGRKSPSHKNIHVQIPLGAAC